MVGASQQLIMSQSACMLLLCPPLCGMYFDTRDPLAQQSAIVAALEVCILMAGFQDGLKRTVVFLGALQNYNAWFG